MEYLPNGDLHKYLGSAFPEREGQEIVSQVLEGLDFMHQNGFAHRDLKPAVSLIIPLILVETSILN
jgi:serine/threonine protein kinase